MCTHTLVSLYVDIMYVIHTHTYVYISYNVKYSSFVCILLKLNSLMTLNLYK